VFYHPKDLGESPAKVASKVWEHLHPRKGKLDLDLRLVTRNEEIADRYQDSLIDDKAIKGLNKDTLFYFPISPAISLKPSTSLLLRLKGKDATIISDYHGDFREDMYNHLQNREVGMFLYSIPSATLASMIINWHEHIILHSHYLKRIIKRRYKVRSKITVVPNGVDKEVLGRRYSPIDLEGEFNIFFHGRHSHEKGLDMLIDAIGSIPKKDRKKVHLYIAGRGPMTTSLKKRTSERGLDPQVHFLGYPPLEEVFSHMRSVDLVVYPSRYDNFPVAVLEALAVADSPVFFSDKMGLADYANPDLKDHVFPLSKRAIKGRITEVMKGDLDIKAVVKRQRRFAKRFTWDKVIKDYIDFFNRLV
jgi:glycosyltransferase involved in cell wall biosynthesis